MMAWVLVVAGGVAVLMPGYLDPFTPVNGLTLLGLGLVFAGLRVARG